MSMSSFIIAVEGKRFSRFGLLPEQISVLGTTSMVDLHIYFLSSSRIIRFGATKVTQEQLCSPTMEKLANNSSFELN
jgi:hypothetical protein